MTTCCGDIILIAICAVLTSLGLLLNSTAGISLGPGNLALSTGAGILFLMNVVSIRVSGLGMRPKRQ